MPPSLREVAARRADGRSNQNIHATLMPPVSPCFVPAKPVRFKSSVMGTLSFGVMVAPSSPRKLPPPMSAPLIAAQVALSVGGVVAAAVLECSAFFERRRKGVNDKPSR